MSEHWTERGIDAYAFYISSCFVERVLRQMKATGCSRTTLARRLKVTRARVTQLLCTAPPENMTVEMMARVCRALGMDLALVAYEQGEERAKPIDSEVFERCWEESGRPPDFWKWHNPEDAGSGDAMPETVVSS